MVVKKKRISVLSSQRSIFQRVGDGVLRPLVGVTLDGDRKFGSESSPTTYGASFKNGTDGRVA